MSSQCPCVKSLVPRLWCYWEVVEPLGGRAKWEEGRPLGMFIKGIPAPGSLSLVYYQTSSATCFCMMYCAATVRGHLWTECSETEPK
jgi:hypothetical protein